MVTKTPKDSMTNKWCNLVGRNRKKKQQKHMWALEKGGLLEKYGHVWYLCFDFWGVNMSMLNS